MLSLVVLMLALRPNGSLWVALGSIMTERQRDP